MTHKWKHWCPLGCGKKVLYRGNGWRTINKPVYVCEKCDSKFTKKQIDKF